MLGCTCFSGIHSSRTQALNLICCNAVWCIGVIPGKKTKELIDNSVRSFVFNITQTEGLERHPNSVEISRKLSAFFLLCHLSSFLLIICLYSHGQRHQTLHDSNLWNGSYLPTPFLRRPHPNLTVFLYPWTFFSSVKVLFSRYHHCVSFLALSHPHTLFLQCVGSKWVRGTELPTGVNPEQRSSRMLCAAKPMCETQIRLWGESSEAVWPWWCWGWWPRWVPGWEWTWRRVWRSGYGWYCTWWVAGKSSLARQKMGQGIFSLSLPHIQQRRSQLSGQPLLSSPGSEEKLEGRDWSCRIHHQHPCSEMLSL